MRFYLNKIPKLYCVDHPLPFFFILAVLGLHCSAGFSLVEVGGGYSPAAGPGRPSAVASLAGERGLWARGLGSRLCSAGFAAPQHVGYLRIEPMSPALVGRFFTSEPPGKPLLLYT